MTILSLNDAKSCILKFDLATIYEISFKGAQKKQEYQFKDLYPGTSYQNKRNMADYKT